MYEHEEKKDLIKIKIVHLMEIILGVDIPGLQSAYLIAVLNITEVHKKFARWVKLNIQIHINMPWPIPDVHEKYRNDISKSFDTF